MSTSNQLITYARMQNPPRFVVMLVLFTYMNGDEVERMKSDLAKLKRVTDAILVDRFKKYMDIERLIKQPLLPQDAMVYNYIQYEFTGKFRKTKLLARYEREMLLGRPKVMDEMRQVLNALNIGL